MTDTDIREFLERMAAEPVVEPLDAEPLVRAAHHRLTRNAIGGLIAIALAVGVLLGGTALLRSSPTVPAEPPSVTPQPIPPLMHNGPIALIGYLDGVVQVDPDGTPAGRLVGCDKAGGSCTETGAAAWSSDGTKLAYAAQCGGGCGDAGDPFHGIRVLDVRTGADELILPGESFTALDWSPDGTRIAYSERGRFEDGTWVPDGGLSITTLDGSESTRLPLAQQIESISWSPDGTSILYGQQTETGYRFDMYVGTVDGSGRRYLGHGRNPEWSPDGTRIAYARGGTQCEIWTMAPDGSNRIEIASIDRPSPPDTSCNTGPWQPGPAWSPDGHRLAFLLDRALWIVHDDGSHLVRVDLATPQSVWGIAWRPVTKGEEVPW